MARPRAQSSAELSKEPHSISLKGKCGIRPFSEASLTANLHVVLRYACHILYKTILAVGILTSTRLSRPSLAQQYPLPRKTPRISPLASLAFPAKSSDQEFILGANVIKKQLVRSRVHR